MTDDGRLDYARLARLLELATREHRDLAATSNDPLERYEASTNVHFFAAARTAATEYLTRPRRMAQGG